jgi:hypothetical protein
MRLTWKRQASETGLRCVAQGPRGAILSIDGTHAGTVSPRSTGFHEWSGWYWVAGWKSEVPHKNTSGRPVATLDEAKRDCEAYVRASLGMPAKKARP